MAIHFTMEYFCTGKFSENGAAATVKAQRERMSGTTNNKPSGGSCST